MEFCDMEVNVEVKYSTQHTIVLSHKPGVVLRMEPLCLLRNNVRVSDGKYSIDL